MINWEKQRMFQQIKLLEEIFSSYNKFANWSDNANYLLNKLGFKFSGKAFESQSAEEDRIKTVIMF